MATPVPAVYPIPSHIGRQIDIRFGVNPTTRVRNYSSWQKKSGYSLQSFKANDDYDDFSRKVIINTNNEDEDDDDEDNDDDENDNDDDDDSNNREDKE